MVGKSLDTCQLPEVVRASFQASRSEEHTSELQSHVNLVCRLLLEKKNNLGWPAFGPYYAIIATASSVTVPGAIKLLSSDGGRMIIQIRLRKQQLIVVTVDSLYFSV